MKYHQLITKIAVGKLVLSALICFDIVRQALAQSIGYQPQLNFGFNPYMSPVYGYGLGLPFGAYNLSPIKNPWLAHSMFDPFNPAGVMSKIHAKSFLTKLATSKYNFYPYYGNLKAKLNLLKHPSSLATPYSKTYGYGRHYGAAMLPNNPYKSVYGDYYDQQGEMTSDQLPVASEVKLKTYKLAKPLMKAGALLTAAALLGKRPIDNVV